LSVSLCVFVRRSTAEAVSAAFAEPTDYVDFQTGGRNLL
jgi:hypothetical protein